MASEIAESCVPVFVSVCVWLHRGSPLYVSVHCFDKPVALMTRFWRKSLHCSRLSLACTFSAHVNDAHLFVTLNDHWIEETVSFKMSQDFLRQVLITTLPDAHEADHHATARFHECDTWLSFALCHCSNEHVIRLELRFLF